MRPKRESEIPMKKTTIRLPEDVWRAARIRALDENRDFQDLVADALQRYLKKPTLKGSKKQ